MNLVTWKVRMNSHYSAVLFLTILVSIALYLTAESGVNILEKKEEEPKRGNGEEKITRCNEDRKLNNTTRNDSFLSCNIFSGKWVFDNITYPLYKEAQCSFMTKTQFACEGYGRKDLKYQNWRWQPHECDLPRFNGTAFLEEIRGKKLVFVGDSLNKNQWISMLCLIESSLNRSSPKSIIRDGNLFTFHATEYNATIGFYWSPLLVESNCDDPYVHRAIKDRRIRITAIEKHARHWTDANILIFDSFMWWLEPSMTLLWGSFGSSDVIYKKVEMKLRRYEMALNTWSDWLEININRTKTKLFYMSLSPYHFMGDRFEEQKNCYNETEPISKEGYWGLSTDREMMEIAESTIRKLEMRGVKVEYLNITHLSDYRRDAHPSIYRKDLYPPTEEQLANLRSYQDCAHWCLPGVPDIWNQILYSYIVTSS